MQKQEGAFPRQSSAERKEALYDEIITLFDKGKVRVASLFHTVMGGLVPCRILVSVPFCRCGSVEFSSARP